MRSSIACLVLLFFASIQAGSAQAQAFYDWVGSSGGSWSTASNWFPARTSPAASDRLVFQTGTTLTVLGVPNTTIGQIAVLNGTNVTLQGNLSTGNTVNLTGGLGADLDVRAGCFLTLNGSRITLQLQTGTTGVIAGELRMASTAHRLLAVDANAIVFPSGGIARALPGFTGGMFGVGSANSGAGSVHFQAGSTFILSNSADDPFGTAAAAVTVFEAGSLFRFLSGTAALTENRTFANIQVDAGAGGSAQFFGTVGCTMDTLVINSGTFFMTHTAQNTIRGQLRLASGARLIVGHASSAGSLRFAGTVPQVIDGVQDMPESSTPGFLFRPTAKLVIDNPAGVRFPGTAFPRFDVPGGVELVQGVFHLDNFTALRVNPPFIGGSETSWVHGRVHKALPPGAPTEVIPVGTATEYLPLTLAFQETLAETTTVSVILQTPGDPPITPLTNASFAGAQIDTTKKVNVHYNLSFFNAFTTVPPPKFGVEMTYRPANLDPGAEWSKFVPRMRSIGSGADPNTSWRNPIGALIANDDHRMALLWLFSPPGDHPTDYAFVFAVGEASTVNVSAEDGSIVEGGGALRTPTLAGVTTLPMRVFLSEPSVTTITVDYATSGGSAQAGTDYTPQSGTLTFQPGEVEKIVDVPVSGEADAEANETLLFTLSNVTGGGGAVIADGQATGTILDDDDVVAPTVAVLYPNGGETIIEGSSVNLLWSATDNVGVVAVDLLLSKDGGATWEPIAGGLPNTGSYAWTAPVGLTHQARLRAVAADHRPLTSNDESDAVWSIWGVDDVEPLVPGAFALSLASANPSRGSARLRLAMPQEQSVRADVYNIAGRRVATIVDGVLPAGVHDLEWRGEGTAPGLYFVDLVTAGFRARERIVRLP